jgi:hypothetical protein
MNLQTNRFEILNKVNSCIALALLRSIAAENDKGGEQKKR